MSSIQYSILNSNYCAIGSPEPIHLITESLYSSTSIFPNGSMVKKPPALQETWIWSLGQEDSLEEEMATHSSILAWRIPWTGAWRTTVHGVMKSQTWLCVHMHAHVPTHTHTHTQSGFLLDVKHRCCWSCINFVLHTGNWVSVLLVWQNPQLHPRLSHWFPKLTLSLCLKDLCRIP